MPMPMEDISSCMVRVTGELQTLQEQLRLIQSCDASTQDRVLDDLLGLGLIQDLKSAVDQMRNFLWSCVDSAALNCNPQGQTDQLARKDYLPQITALLRLLHGSPAAPQSFVEQVTRSVDTLMGKKDAA